MYTRSLIFTAVALAMACRCAPALANDQAAVRHGTPGLQEVSDDELADMRGRYIVGNDTVLYFGVEMVSTWQTNTGQTLQGTITLSMDFSKNPNLPQVTFVPTVTIITTVAPPPASSSSPSNISRSVQSAGLANVGGLIQGIQVAGSNNAASNVTLLNVQSGGNAPASSNSSGNSSPSANPASSSTGVGLAATSPGTGVNISSTTSNGAVSGNTPSPGASSLPIVDTGTGTATGRAASAGNASVTSTYANNGAQVTLAMAGMGSATQWIQPGNLGQTIALTADNQTVTNQMIVSLVTQSLTATTSQLARTLAQSMNLTHSNSR